MTRSTTSRPRMAAIYAPGTVRARRWHGDDDVRGYRPPRGWTARADLTDVHPPHHGPRLAACHVVAHRDEGVTAISTAPRPFLPGRGGRKNPGAAVTAPGLEGQQQNQNVAVCATAQTATLR
jgi:hypothetical protein